MTPALHDALTGLLTVLAAFAWLRRCPLADDAETSAAHELVLESLSDADFVGKVNCATDGDLRSQLSVADALALHEEAELAKLGARRN